jgi:C-terminal processing protease CtpA/Prc
VPILISELEPDGAAAKCGALYVGDAILSANGQDLKQVTLIMYIIFKANLCKFVHQTFGGVKIKIEIDMLILCKWFIGESAVKL